MIRNRILQLATFSIIFFYSCSSKPDGGFSEKEKNDFLDTLVSNISVSIDDITEIKRKPTKDLIIITKYTFGEKKKIENDKLGFVKNDENDISDFGTYSIVDYKLINENNKELKFVEDGMANYLQETSLQEINGQLYQYLIIQKQLNQVYTKLTGNINIRIEMPNNFKRKLKYQ
jgi:hypothetical protein